MPLLLSLGIRIGFSHRGFPKWLDSKWLTVEDLPGQQKVFAETVRALSSADPQMLHPIADEREGCCCFKIAPFQEYRDNGFCLCIIVRLPQLVPAA